MASAGSQDDNQFQPLADSVPPSNTQNRCQPRTHHFPNHQRRIARNIKVCGLVPGCLRKNPRRGPSVLVTACRRRHPERGTILAGEGREPRESEEHRKRLLRAGNGTPRMGNASPVCDIDRPWLAALVEMGHSGQGRRAWMLGCVGRGGVYRRSRACETRAVRIADGSVDSRTRHSDPDCRQTA